MRSYIPLPTDLRPPSKRIQGYLQIPFITKVCLSRVAKQTLRGSTAGNRTFSQQLLLLF